MFRATCPRMLRVGNGQRRSEEAMTKGDGARARRIGDRGLRWAVPWLVAVVVCYGAAFVRESPAVAAGRTGASAEGARVVANADGRLEVFSVFSGLYLLHKYQVAPNGS